MSERERRQWFLFVIVSLALSVAACVVAVML
jgi:hypothetical protein